MSKHPKRPRDPNQFAKLIVDIAGGEAVDAPAANMTPERRSETAKKAAVKRWGCRTFD